jgi:hypothetical protein
MRVRTCISRRAAATMFTLLVAVLPACSDFGTDPTPTPPPVTTDVKFGRDVQAIFNSSCAISGCHVQPMPTAGLNLTAGSSYANLVNVPTQVFTPGVRITPGDVNASVLYLLVESGQMPARGARLTPAQVSVIRTWIEDGAPNN